VRWSLPALSSHSLTFRCSLVVQVSRLRWVQSSTGEIHETVNAACQLLMIEGSAPMSPPPVRREWYFCKTFSIASSESLTCFNVVWTDWRPVDNRPFRNLGVPPASFVESLAPVGCGLVLVQRVACAASAAFVLFEELQVDQPLDVSQRRVM
jgi:hypothetical protein